jgi:NAD(P)H dehydrogenase (quinone)
LLYLAINAAQHSMIWVGAGEMTQANGVNRLGSYIGVMGQTTPDYSGAKGAELVEGDRLSCELYGQRLAEATARWNQEGGSIQYPNDCPPAPNSGGA